MVRIVGENYKCDLIMSNMMQVYEYVKWVETEEFNGQKFKYKTIKWENNND